MTITRTTIEDPPDPSVSDPRVKVRIEGPDCFAVLYLTPEGMGSLMRAVGAYRADIAAGEGKRGARGVGEV